MLKLMMTAWNTFDLALIDQAEDANVADMKTAIYALLFTDQRAAAERVEDPYDQRGWWYDPQMGTGLWYVRRQALSENAAQEAKLMVEQALLSDALISDLNVELDQLAGNVSQLILTVNGVYDGMQFSVMLPTLVFVTT